MTKTHEVSRREANASSTLTHCECQEHCWCRIRGLAMPPPVPAGVACRRYTRKRAGHRHQRRLRSVRQIDWYRARRIRLRHGADHIAGRLLSISPGGTSMSQLLNARVTTDQSSSRLRLGKHGRRYTDLRGRRPRAPPRGSPARRRRAASPAARAPPARSRPAAGRTGTGPAGTASGTR